MNFDYNRAKEVFKNISNIEGELNSKVRRGPLIDLMYKLKSENKNCYSCEGFCCTYAHNSMLVTPIEAFDALAYLYENNRVDSQLIDELNESIKEYRLDNEMMIGRGREFRRNYTCPFFKPGPRGCTISPEQKPYGCLGFNALEENVNVRGKCTSYLDTLESRDDLNQENESKINEILREEYQIYWDKKNLPVALVELISKIF